MTNGICAAEYDRVVIVQVPQQPCCGIRVFGCPDDEGREPDDRCTVMFQGCLYAPGLFGRARDQYRLAGQKSRCA